MNNLTTLAHHHFLTFINKQYHSHYFLDGTCGNGYDTLFLAQQTGLFGKVWAFDIQIQALETTKQYLKKHNYTSKVSLIHDSHEHNKKYIPQDKQGYISGFMLNLGYLPKSDKKIITQAHSTIKALDSFPQLLAPEGGGTVLVYPGHKGGEEEALTIQKWLNTQKKYRLIFTSHQDKPKDPFLIVLKKISVS